jgi:hypothetical protein
MREIKKGNPALCMQEISVDKVMKEVDAVMEGGPFLVQ